MAASSPSPPVAPRPRGFLRYSLRALLIFLTLACVGLWYWYRVPYKSQRLHPQGLPWWTERTGPVVLTKEVRRYRRTLRGDPIREGLTELFDAEGRRIGEQMWREGRLHGRWTLWYTSGQVREQGEYARGQMQGTWERFDETGQLSVRMPFDKGDPHGEWRWFDRGKPVRTILFDHTEVKQIDGRPIDDPLGRACRLGHVDDYRIRDMVPHSGSCDFKNVPLKDVIQYISENYSVNVRLDFALSKAGVRIDTPVTLREERLTAGAMLVLLSEPLGLAPTYQFGMIWITTKDKAKGWVDRTGVGELLKSAPAEVLPSDLGKVRAALGQPAEFDFLDTPLQDISAYLSEMYRVPIECDSAVEALPVTNITRGVTLQNALGALCDQFSLRIRWRDGKTLIIEPQERTE